MYLAWSDIKAHDVTTFQPYSKERLVYIRRPKCDDVDFFQEPYAGYCLGRQEDGMDWNLKNKVFELHAFLKFP